MSRRSFSFPVVVIAIVAFSTSCSQEHGIGDESLLDFQEREQQRLGQASPTPSPEPQEQAPAPKEKQGVGQQQPQQQAQPQQPAIEIAIQSDNAGSAFNPSVVRVSQGGKVSWINRDSVVRSVEADNGAFKSGPIAPGESWTWTATVTGKHGYHDGTRPYAVASLEVVG